MVRRCLLGVLALLVLGGCGVSPAGPTRAREVASGTARTTKVLVVVEENHSLGEMRSGMPYLWSLSRTYGYATDWHAITHPSEPNYLAIAGGSTFGVTDDALPATNAAKVGSARSVLGQALAAGRTARTYAEAMPSACYRANTSGRYAARHNPWVYFGSERSRCLHGDVGTGPFLADARADRLPNVGFLVPDLAHDAHDGTLATADRWLRAELTPVLASSDFTSGRLAVVVTADEDDRHHGNVVLTSVLSAHVHHRVVTTRLTHYSLTRFLDQVLGQPPLRNAAKAPSMGSAFGL